MTSSRDSGRMHHTQGDFRSQSAVVPLAVCQSNGMVVVLSSRCSRGMHLAEHVFKRTACRGASVGAQVSEHSHHAIQQLLQVKQRRAPGAATCCMCGFAILVSGCE